MESRFGGLDLADLDAVTVADQPRVAYHTGLAGAKAACDWKQATETVTLFIPVRPGTSSRNMEVRELALLPEGRARARALLGSRITIRLRLNESRFGFG